MSSYFTPHIHFMRAEILNIMLYTMDGLKYVTDYRVVSASDVTPIEHWLNVWSVKVVVGFVELYRISGRHVCHVL